jgi:hypothetical protein
MGVYGVVLTIVGVIAYLASLESFGSPILAPIAPLIPADLKDTLYLGHLSEMELRPESLKTKNKRRMRNN